MHTIFLWRSLTEIDGLRGMGVFLVYLTTLCNYTGNNVEWKILLNDEL
jgi:hypothetical protein